MLRIFWMRPGAPFTTHLILDNDDNDGPRSDLLSSVDALLLPHGFSSLSNELLLKIILYGDHRLTTDVNKKLLEAPLKFIHALNAFK